MNECDVVERQGSTGSGCNDENEAKIFGAQGAPIDFQGHMTVRIDTLSTSTLLPGPSKDLGSSLMPRGRIAAASCPASLPTALIWRGARFGRASRPPAAVDEVQ